MPRSRRPLYALFASDSISLTGNVVARVAVPWFVLETTGSAALTGVTAFFTFLPTVIALFLGGAVVDRLGFARTSVAADLASGAAVALIPALHVTVGIELWQLIALVFVGALLDAPGTTAREALLPDVAELAGMGLERASGINSAIHRGSVLVGAPVAGVLVAALGAANVLWVNAASFLVSAFLIRLLGPASGPEPDAEPPRRFLAELLQGVRFIWSDRLLRAIVLTVLATNFLDAPLFSVLMPVYARESFGSAVDLGLILGTLGGFGLLGSILFGAFGHRLPRRRTFVSAFLVASLPYLALSTLPSLPVTLTLMAAWGLALGPINPIIATVEYERIPVALRGRVLGAITAGAWASIPAGALLGGLFIEWFGVETTLLAIGACYLAVTAFGVVNPAFRAMDESSA